jgi:hypothetical protein
MHESDMKALHTATAVIELGAGLALLFCPSATVLLLLGSPLDTLAGAALGRVAGAALTALGIANWLARPNAQSSAARGLVAAMTFYNAGAAVVLGIAGLQIHPVGIALVPAVVLHAAMTVWCMVCLVGKPRQADGLRNE